MNLKISIVGYEQLQKFAGWQMVLRRNLGAAFKDSVEKKLQPTAASYMFAHFQNPTGALEDNFSYSYAAIAGGVQAALINDSPYAWRREEGFSGMTDSLGRYYANDPGIHYMQYTLDQNTATIVQQVSLAVQLSLQELKGP